MIKFKANMKDFKDDKLNILKLALAFDISDIITKAYKENKDVVFVCIGTDKVMLDAFGPLIGTGIKEHLAYMPNVRVYGEIGCNINALNGKKNIEIIKKQEKNSVIIAVDATATLKDEDLGNIRLGKDSVSPGKGNNKDIEAIGDYSLTLCSCFVAKDENDKYSLDSSKTLKAKEIFDCVDIVMESLAIAADNVISNMLKSLAE